MRAGVAVGGRRIRVARRLVDPGRREVAVSRSGTPTTPNGARKRPMVTITLSPDAIARLDEIASARGTTRSGAVEQLIRRARIASE